MKVASQMESRFREQPWVEFTLTNLQRLIIPSPSSDAIVAGMESILDQKLRDVGPAHPMLVSVVLRDDAGQLYPSLCQVDGDPGVFEIRHGWDAYLRSKRLLAGDTLAIQLDQYSTRSCIFMRVRIVERDRAGREGLQAALSGEMRLRLARNGTLSMGGGPPAAVQRNIELPDLGRKRTFSIELDQAIDECRKELHHSRTTSLTTPQLPSPRPLCSTPPFSHGKRGLYQPEISAPKKPRLVLKW